jgi:hypothetical protein
MDRVCPKWVRAAALAALAPMIGACATGEWSLGNVNVVPRASDLMRPDWMSFSGHKEEFSLRPAGPEDLVSPDGQCAAAVQAQSADQSGDLPPALVQGGVALQMTECDVVRRAGHPEGIEFGTNPRGERTVVLTYMSGPRPGIYRFAAGRLQSIERGPEPAPAPRQQKAAAKKKA